MGEPYVAGLIQAHVTSALDQTQVQENLKHHLELIDRFVPGLEAAYSSTNIGPPVKLLCLSECFLAGFGLGEADLRYATFEANKNVCIHIPGKEIDALGDECKRFGIYMTGSVWEIDDEWPNHFFHTGFVLNPKGKVILKYRKTAVPSFVENAMGPHGILEKYGKDPKKLFPVAETEIGNLGMTICADIYGPESCRAHALNGAEILIVPWEPYFPDTYAIEMYNLVNRVRAYENHCYLISTNYASSPKYYGPTSFGRSIMVDPHGIVIAQLPGNDETYMGAVIDVETLRQERVRPGFPRLGWLRTELFAEVYRTKSCYPPNTWLDRNTANFEETQQLYIKNVERLIEQKIYARPVEKKEKPNVLTSARS